MPAVVFDNIFDEPISCLAMPRACLLNLFCLSACAGFFGLWGIGWNLPSKERLGWILPPGLDTPAFHKELQESWTRMHRMLGDNLVLASQELTSFSGLQRVPSGWKTPPPVLLNCIRSFYLRSAHDDEQTFLILLSKMDPRRLDFRPRMFLYGGGYLYPLGAWLAGSAALGFVRLSHGLAPYLARPEQLAGLYLSGRLFSFFGFWLCAVYLWFLGRKLLGETGALLAGLVYALSPSVLIQSHVMKQHMLWPLWALACLHASMLLLDRASLARRLAAGAAAGLCAGTFSVCAWIVLVPAAASCLRLHRGAPWREEAAGLCWSALATIAAVLAVNPYWITNAAEVRAEFSFERGYAGFCAPAPWLFLRDQFRRALGWPIELAALLGAASALRSKDDRLRLLAFAFAASLLPIFYTGAAHMDRGARYSMASVAFAGLLAAHAASLPRRRGLRAALAGAALLHLALCAAATSSNFANASSRRSTYRRAGLWLEENVRPGDSIGLWILPRPENSPYCRFDRFSIVLLDPYQEKPVPPELLPHWLVLRNPQSFLTPAMERTLERYESVLSFESARVIPWIRLTSRETTANPTFVVCRLIAADRRGGPPIRTHAPRTGRRKASRACGSGSPPKKPCRSA